MSIESRKKLSHVDIVKKALQNGTTRREIPKLYALTKTQVSSSISYLRRKKELPAPSLEESRRTLQESVSEARGGIFLAIEPYAKLRMSPREIEFALALEQGIIIDRKQINSSLTKARLRGKLPALDAEKRKMDQIKKTDEEVKQKIERYIQIAHIHNTTLAEMEGSIEEDNFSAEFLRKVLEIELLNTEGKSWDNLHKLYSTFRRQIPERISDQIRLELFYNVLDAVANQDMSRYEQYKKVGESVDLEWFKSTLREEEYFMKLKFFAPWADGFDTQGRLFRITPRGIVYQTFTDVDGNSGTFDLKAAIHKKQQERILARTTYKGVYR